MMAHSMRKKGFPEKVPLRPLLHETLAEDEISSKKRSSSELTLTNWLNDLTNELPDQRIPPRPFDEGPYGRAAVIEARNKARAKKTFVPTPPIPIPASSLGLDRLGLGHMPLRFIRKRQKKILEQYGVTFAVIDI
jgi:hypothetical protein